MSIDQPPGNGIKATFGVLAPAVEYTVDAAQRSLLYLDVMRQRGNQYRAHLRETVPHVLDYDTELIIDGRSSRASGQLRARPDRPAARG